jgi:hypothetical protein
VLVAIKPEAFERLCGTRQVAEALLSQLAAEGWLAIDQSRRSKLKQVRIPGIAERPGLVCLLGHRLRAVGPVDDEPPWASRTDGKF